MIIPEEKSGKLRKGAEEGLRERIFHETNPVRTKFLGILTLIVDSIKSSLKFWNCSQTFCYKSTLYEAFPFLSIPTVFEFLLSISDI